METKLLWLIPGGGYNLEDGTPITYDVDLIHKKTHIDYCKEFCLEQNIDCFFCNSHDDFAKLLASLGIIVFFNSGVKIGDKYICSIFLPEQMTLSQIAFLENQKELFQVKYDENYAFFKVQVFTNCIDKYPYKIRNNFRDLKIESILKNVSVDNGQILLYQEIETQKEWFENEIKR